MKSRQSILPSQHKRLTAWVPRLSITFWVLTALLLLVSLTGGSSRPDIFSLVALRPLSILTAGYGLWTLRREHIERYPLLFAFALALVLLGLMHIIPLPPKIWSALPGREILIRIEDVVNLAPTWRPFSMTPTFAWNALYALGVPFAVLVLGMQLDPDDLKCVLIVLIGIGVSSAVLGLLQVLGDPSGPLYLYRVTHQGVAVGLFANRNHQALFLAALLPMLAIWAAPTGESMLEARGRSFVALPIGLLLIMLLLVIGSRTGGAVALLGLVTAPLFYGAIGRLRRLSDRPHNIAIAFFGGLFALLCIGAWVVSSGRAETIRRVAQFDLGREDRDEVWTIALKQIGHFFPWGSGAGSYERVFQTIEPDSLLTRSYSNHVHNDWLEVAMTYGLPGILLLAVAVIAWLEAARRLIVGRKTLVDPAWGWLGFLIVLMAAICSITDYPLRTPLVSAQFVLACLWIGFGTTEHRSMNDFSARTTHAPS